MNLNTMNEQYQQCLGKINPEAPMIGNPWVFSFSVVGALLLGLTVGQGGK